VLQGNVAAIVKVRSHSVLGIERALFFGLVLHHLGIRDWEHKLEGLVL